MEISWIQAGILAIMAVCSGQLGALGSTYAWYTLARPLVASLFVGIILGDIPTAITIGAAIQVVYIAVVTPGGAVAAELRAVSYIGIPLAIASVKSMGIDVASTEATGYAVTLAALVGTVGTVMFYGTTFVNLIWQHMGWNWVDDGDRKKILFANYILPLVTHLLVVFIPTLIINKYGVNVVTWIQQTLPMDGIAMKTLFTTGSLLPAVGIAILLKQIVKSPMDLVVFFFGFTLAATLGINLVAASIVGTFFAMMNYKNGMNKISAAATDFDEEEDL
ncbi:PTS mannose/fructose/sorbose/N-acetylgalactosamine transporter subunit IIC [Thomasclavelia ramosa]|uniref:PTS mannose/fructose/sorbose/N-acetylgalactosamine transporter subunit IIC n=1 Tax=Thomasclavelia ramosa TaxID=1547 RepID=UPI0018A0ED2A|nr:PTS sugar transporter subunit IIC [Thomasclavelia ramosa]